MVSTRNLCSVPALGGCWELTPSHLCVSCLFKNRCLTLADPRTCKRQGQGCAETERRPGRAPAAVLPSCPLTWLWMQAPFAA